MDPRAVHLRQLSKDLGTRSGQPQWAEMSERIEAVVKAEKKLNPNVDFYSASTYYALGIPVSLYTPIFAVSRTSGWTAHVLEQFANNRLIRPRAEYTVHQFRSPGCRSNSAVEVHGSMGRIARQSRSRTMFRATGWLLGLVLPSGRCQSRARLSAGSLPSF
jgi:hypothetical protein